MPDHSLENELKHLYRRRFAETVSYRDQVWKILCNDFFREYIPSEGAVMDLGCGYGWFINNITCPTKYGMDLNPNTAEYLEKGVTFMNQDCAGDWGLPDGSLDLVFTSNFLEHLLTKAELTATFIEARRCLKEGGKLVALGPNAKYLAGHYWDFFDHHLALTERSLGEVLEICGFRVKRSVPKFLPYSMVSRTPPLFLVKAYVRLPFAWRFWGKQFLVVAEKSAAEPNH